jgi:hypothetical protein
LPVGKPKYITSASTIVPTVNQSANRFALVQIAAAAAFFAFDGGNFIALDLREARIAGVAVIRVGKRLLAELGSEATAILGID